MMMDTQNCLQDMTSFCLSREEGAVAPDKIVFCGNEGVGMQDCHWLGLGRRNHCSWIDDDYRSGEEAKALRKTVHCRKGAAGL